MKREMLTPVNGKPGTSREMATLIGHPATKSKDQLLGRPNQVDLPDPQGNRKRFSRRFECSSRT
jgi:hypothetical protein